MSKAVLMPGAFLLFAFIGFRIHHAIESAVVPNAVTGQSRIEPSPPGETGSSRIEPIAEPAPPADHMGIFRTITTGGPFTFAGGVLSPSADATNVISVSTAQHELASIRGDGRVFLNGKEVHTDREYREVMMALAKVVAGCKP